MNDIDNMPPKCKDCPYWELAQYPYCCDDCQTKEPEMEELVKKIELILVEEGQHDKKFRLGEIIKYSPSEVKNILLKHKDELK